MFDPEQPEKFFVMEGGRVVGLTETDVEQGGHTEMTALEGEDVSVEKLEEAADDPELGTGKSLEEETGEGKTDRAVTPDVAENIVEEEKTDENREG